MKFSPRENVRKMVPYVPGKPIEDVQRELGLSRVVKLASNENPLGPSPKAVEAVSSAAAKMHLYPDGAAQTLKSALSKFHGIPTEQIAVGNGSDELIHLLGLIALGSESDELIMGDPGFSRYDASAHLGPCQLVKVPLNQDLAHDLPAMAKRATENTKLIVIANPNNPTGTIVNQRAFEQFLKDIPKSALVVLDEAYYEFAQDAPGHFDGIQYVKNGEQVITLRTFSKAYGLAGIRVGYGFATEGVIDAINRAREPFDVNSLAQAAAVAALEDQEHVRKTVELNRKGLNYLKSLAEENGLSVYESHANFGLIELKRPAKPIFEALLQKGIITRSGHALGMPTALRVSIGTEAEMALFGKEFKAVLSASEKG